MLLKRLDPDLAQVRAIAKVAHDDVVAGCSMVSQSEAQRFKK
jgi:hypothetical protein